jgi:hypothetical protein
VALLFLAIVIPVTIEGLQLASYAGQVGQRKAIAARLAENLMNELIATGTWQTGLGSGTWQEDHLEFRWVAQVGSWPEGPHRLLTIRVTFPVQGREQEVRLSTLVDGTSL